MLAWIDYMRIMKMAILKIKIYKSKTIFENHTGNKENNTFALFRNTSATSGFEIISTYLNIKNINYLKNKWKMDLYIWIYVYHTNERQWEKMAFLLKKEVEEGKTIKIWAFTTMFYLRITPWVNCTINLESKCPETKNQLKKIKWKSTNLWR